MAKKRQVHLTSREIIMRMKREAEIRRTSIQAAYTGMTTIALWIFHTEENWSTERMQQYLGRVREYLDLIDEYGDKEVELLKKRYNNDVLDKNEQTKDRSEVVTIKKKGNPLWFAEAQGIITDNLIVKKFDEYMLCHLNTLFDMGINPKRVQMNRKRINDFVENDLEESILVYRKRLFEETGIAVGMPGQSDEDIMREFDCEVV